MDWFSLHAKPILDSIVYSVLGTLILCGSVWFVQRILPFSTKKEIEEDQNTALGIVLAAFIIGLSLIIAAAIQG